MIKFLIHRPISVFMAFTACVILGVITYFNIPVSLLPNIPIPEITVQVTGKNISARELENTVVRPLRQQLMQVDHLRDIRSETRDETARIKLSFEYGVRTDLAFIEVNEKVDGAMNSLPKNVDRPRVVKASATDVPVFNLNLTLKRDIPFRESDEAAFLQLCESAQNVIKRRLEQLPEVAMADVSGVVSKQLVIVPDMAKMEMLGITQPDLESALAANNVEPGSTTVRDGHYEYKIKFSTVLRTPQDVENVYLRIKGNSGSTRNPVQATNDRLIRLKEVARVELVPENEKGACYFNGKRAVTLALVKQSDENMRTFNSTTGKVLNSLRKQYPDVEFSLSQNQATLLDVTIGSLQQDLIMGLILICLVALFFLRDFKMPVVIALTMLVALVVSMLVLYLFHISLNIVSLSGLILSLGMMIDSAIIVTDNITQHREKGFSLEEACVRGTNEVITPMLSSTMTTVSVFVPLVFMSGIAGAIFYDQAVSIALSLFVSYFTGILFLPVLYKLVFAPERIWNRKRWNLPPAKHDRLAEWYIQGVDWAFAHKKTMYAIAILSIPLCAGLFSIIEKEKMPSIDHNEMVMQVDWNENIHLEENRERMNRFLQHLKQITTESSAQLGQQQFLLNRDREQGASEVKIYLKTQDAHTLIRLEKIAQDYFRSKYPMAIVSVSPPETVFEKIFTTADPDLVVELYPRNGTQTPGVDSLQQLQRELEQMSGNKLTGQPVAQQLNLTIDREKLMLYGVSYDELIRKLKTLFSENQFATLRSYTQYLPVAISGGSSTVSEVLDQTLLEGDNNQMYPLNYFVKVTPGSGAKEIVSGKKGEYIPFYLSKIKKDDGSTEKVLSAGLSGHPEWDFDLTGGIFQNREMLNQLFIILMVSILLMYFILAAQFESFLQPLIVLVEIPIDVAAAILLLQITGHTLNLMSAIGIVVTCGIIINDSILKIDVINELRKSGVPLMEAIHGGGKRRLRAILMTALTSMLALVPLLFSHDMGSELQKPLAIAMIGAMVIGTLVSLFLIPLVYWLIYRREEA